MSTQKVEVKTAPIVLMEDNLAKAKRALMVTKQLCPSELIIQALECKAQIGEKDMSMLSKLRETMIRKSGNTVHRSRSTTGIQSKDKPGVQPSVTM